MYSSVAKGTSQGRTVKKIKPVALAIVELRKSKGIRQARVSFRGGRGEHFPLLKFSLPPPPLEFGLPLWIF